MFALGGFVRWFRHGSGTTPILILLSSSLLIYATVRSFSQESSAPAQQNKPSSAGQRQPSSSASEATYPPEIQISDFMLQPRSKIEAVLGKPVKQYECSETSGQQYDYNDGSYLCVEHGRVILLSYSLHRIPSNVEEALGAVGLRAMTQPFTPYGSVNIWSTERGNPFIIGTMSAHQVTAFVGRVSSVEVDMRGPVPLGTQSNTPEATKQKQQETAADKEVREFVGARIAYAGFLDALLKSEGYLIRVEATGDNQQTLDVFSGLIPSCQHL